MLTMAILAVVSGSNGIISNNITHAKSAAPGDVANVHIQSQSKTRVVNNQIAGTLTSLSCQNSVFDGNTVLSLDVQYSHDSLFTDSVCTEGGIVLYNTNDAMVARNKIVGDNWNASAAIELSGFGNRNTVRDNIYEYSGWPESNYGLKIGSSQNVTHVGWNQFCAAIQPFEDLGSDTDFMDMVYIYFRIDEPTLSVGTGLRPTPYSASGTVVAVQLIVEDWPEGDSIIVDVTQGGNSLWATQSAQPRIWASFASNSGYVATNANRQFSETTFMVDIDQVGSTVAGGYLTVVLCIVPDCAA